jgi:hypothetical protein
VNQPLVTSGNATQIGGSLLSILCYMHRDRCKVQSLWSRVDIPHGFALANFANVNDPLGQVKITDSFKLPYFIEYNVHTSIVCT